MEIVVMYNDLYDSGQVKPRLAFHWEFCITLYLQSNIK